MLNDAHQGRCLTSTRATCQYDSFDVIHRVLSLCVQNYNKSNEPQNKTPFIFTLRYLFQSVPTDFQSVRLGLRVRSLRTTNKHQSEKKMSMQQNKEPLLDNNQSLFGNNQPLLDNNQPVLYNCLIQVDFENVPNILTFLLQTLMYRAFGHVRDNQFSLTSP